jgi:hypothetical protein
LSKKQNKKRQTRAAQIAEADAIYEWLVLARATAGDLINRVLRQVKDRSEISLVRLDLRRIAITLARAHPAIGALWHGYERHFVDKQARSEFFRAVSALARAAASTSIYVGATWAFRGEVFDRPEIAWDEQILPQEIAPEVTRLSILYPRILKQFLKVFFKKMSALSTDIRYRRALAILDAVPTLGWSDEEHADHLINLGLLPRSEGGSEVETVKKFIRDLRNRYRRSGSAERRRKPKTLRGRKTPQS